MKDNEPSTSAKNPTTDASWWRLAGLASQIGYIIAIPAVLFAFGGAYLDKNLGTSPLFVILGLSFAFLVSAFGVAKVIREITEGAGK